MAIKAGRRVGMLTARYVETVKQVGLYGDGGGLYLKVGEGSKSWIVRWSSGGSVRKLGLGATHTVSLAQARDRAANVRLLILDGIDPREARRAAAVAAAKTISFDKAADAYIESHKAGWKNPKHAAQWRATLATYASPVFGKLPVSAIDTGLVMRALETIWTTRNATAFRLRGRIEAVLSWAKVHGYREGENPAIWRGNLDHLLPPPSKVRRTVHHAALPYDQLPDFMRDLRARQDVAARALEFAILTATRTSETLHAAWTEFDLANKLWTIPPERMKVGKEHRVPLCDRAIAIIEGMRAVRSADLVFPGAKRGRPLNAMTFLLLLRRMDRDETAHGFRATFRTWAAEHTNVQREVIEAALAHVVGDETERSYQRGDLLDKRRLLMDAWSSYCDSRAATGNVVAFR